MSWMAETTSEKNSTSQSNTIYIQITTRIGNYSSILLWFCYFPRQGWSKARFRTQPEGSSYERVQLYCIQLLRSGRLRNRLLLLSKGYRTCSLLQSIFQTMQNKQYELVALLGLGKCHDQGKKQEKAIEIL